MTPKSKAQDKSNTNKARTRVSKTYKLFIAGKFPRTESGRYYAFTAQSAGSSFKANICTSSRKDFRNAVVAARSVQKSWAAASACLRGQILYRLAEILEDRRDQFIGELILQGASIKHANKEVDASIDRLVYYAGWSDKYQQIFSNVNPVSSSHFNFSILEPTGVVAILPPAAEENQCGLLGMISNIAPAIVGGNTCVFLTNEKQPLTAISFAEVIQASDVPGGVVNILTGSNVELMALFASHKDVNSLVHMEKSLEDNKKIQELASENLKRVICRSEMRWHENIAESPYMIEETQEVKTTWHPIGN
ncbi:MAG: aldehyde dehydrogenase family protein [Pseudomonadales bacterium]|nr:aldehyde dehydrogenase family protein [Pseudomonadales bacterium]